MAAPRNAKSAVDLIGLFNNLNNQILSEKSALLLERSKQPATITGEQFYEISSIYNGLKQIIKKTIKELKQQHQLAEPPIKFRELINAITEDIDKTKELLKIYIKDSTQETKPSDTLKVTNQIANQETLFKVKARDNITLSSNQVLFLKGAKHLINAIYLPETSLFKGDDQIRYVYYVDNCKQVLKNIDNLLVPSDDNDVGVNSKRYEYVKYLIDFLKNQRDKILEAQSKNQLSGFHHHPLESKEDLNDLPSFEQFLKIPAKVKVISDDSLKKVKKINFFKQVVTSEAVKSKLKLLDKMFMTLKSVTKKMDAQLKLGNLSQAECEQHQEEVNKVKNKLKILYKELNSDPKKLANIINKLNKELKPEYLKVYNFHLEVLKKNKDNLDSLNTSQNKPSIP